MRGFLKCCRGRDRTFTRQLVVAQSSVVDPGRSSIATFAALCYIYPVSSPPRQEGMSAKNFITPQFKELTVCCFDNANIKVNTLFVANISTIIFKI
jgi:hypothetical protein